MPLLKSGNSRKRSVICPTLAWLHFQLQILQNRGVFSQTSAGSGPMCVWIYHTARQKWFSCLLTGVFELLTIQTMCVPSCRAFSHPLSIYLVYQISGFPTWAGAKWGKVHGCSLHQRMKYQHVRLHPKCGLFTLTKFLCWSSIELCCLLSNWHKMEALCSYWSLNSGPPSSTPVILSHMAGKYSEGHFKSIYLVIMEF